MSLAIILRLASIVPFIALLRYYGGYQTRPRPGAVSAADASDAIAGAATVVAPIKAPPPPPPLPPPPPSAEPSAPPTKRPPSQHSTQFGTRKVIVPAIYKEWRYDFGNFSLQGERYPPFWFWNETFQAEYGFTTVLYQKQNKSAPHYISTNRGCENGAYFNFIVDHYDDFPDIAVFVHAKPEEHISGSGLDATMRWLNYVKCLRPNMTYASLNVEKFFCRNSWNGIWAKKGIWIEQCLRDTLQVAWDLMDNQTEFHARVPPQQPIQMCTHCCQQFAVSRKQVLKRPLRVWQRLRDILSVQDQCHVGEPDYENLYAYIKSQRWKLGEEPVNLSTGKPGSAPGYGRYTQAVAAEHLAHVIFGEHPLVMPQPTRSDTCAQYLPSSECPGSPCEV